MIQQILEYQKILTSIDDVLSKSAYKKSYIIEKIGIPAPTFYRKLKTYSFTVAEMLSIAKIIAPEEAYLYELKESIRKGKEDIKKGKVHKHEDVIAEIKQELLR